MVLKRRGDSSAHTLRPNTKAVTILSNAETRTHTKCSRGAIMMAVVLGCLTWLVLSRTFIDTSLSPPVLAVPEIERYHWQNKHHTSNPVVVVRNFLPVDLARKWRDTMKQLWEAREADQNRSAWSFTTNNEGTMPDHRQINRKFRSLQKQEVRLKIARTLDRQGQFAYAKWEIKPGHPLLQEVSQFMLRNETLSHVATLLNLHHGAAQIDSSELSDLFITYFDESNFLSSHNDGNSGTYAFVVNLSDGPEWQPTFGGSLQFQCARNSDWMARDWCQHIGPRFNTLHVFKTRPLEHAPAHKVDYVTPAATTAGWRRFGYTGWYNDISDKMNEEELRVRNQMRGNEGKY